jgi:chitin disaccharide deacetylase
MSSRILVVNADDFGRSPGVNGGVIRAHEEGIVTSASLMVRWPAAEEAAQYARASKTLGVGLHLDLGEWEYRDGDWHARYLVVEEETPRTVGDELARQLESFERLVGRAPTHVDSHQHVHNSEPVRSAVLATAERLGVPVRAHTPGIEYCGAFYGQDGRGTPVPEAIEVDALVAVIDGLPLGTVELACHPAAEADHESTYDRERLTELETLCDRRVREAIERLGIELRSFAGLCHPPDGGSTPGGWKHRPPAR